LKSPWYCPYCEQTSSRKWNVSTHIQRRHPGKYNPFDVLKDIVFTDSHYAQPVPARLNSSNSSAEIDWSDPLQVVNRSTKIQDIMEEIKRLNKFEQTWLLIAIYKLQQS